MTTDTKPLVERLRHASTTASNDDLSKPGTEKRQRHADRVAVMLEAAAALDAKDALLREEAEVLEWYEEKARNCRKLGGIPEGNEARNALSQDGGDRARSLLSKLIEATKP